MERWLSKLKVDPETTMPGYITKGYKGMQEVKHDREPLFMCTNSFFLSVQINVIENRNKDSGRSENTKQS